MALRECKPGTAFPGVVGRTTDVSSPAWPQPVRAVPGSPNVLFIVRCLPRPCALEPATEKEQIDVNNCMEVQRNRKGR